ncbi:hypothetical protein [Conexibacter sp. W3-3-2]|uniref:calcium-binding protein n=1 Tax=Conexibacter sp. W3-3-2 TaxID=2675227 RepID=UPI00281496CD|nr:hypothetical protein [Conexibacter sp. W3-3-2]
MPALAAAFAVLVCAAPAQAQVFQTGPGTNPGTVDLVDGILQYEARDSANAAIQDNDVTITVNGDVATVRDTSANLTAGTGCEQTSDPKVVRCAPGDTGGPGIAAYDIDLNAGDDVARVDGNRPVTGTLDGGAGDDQLTGGLGSDQFLGGPGADSFIGGRATNGFPDVVSYADHAAAVSAGIGNTEGGNGNATDGATGDIIGNDIEVLIGTDAGDELYGNSRANTLVGGAGADILEARAGNDTLYGYVQDTLPPAGRHPRGRRRCAVRSGRLGHALRRRRRGHLRRRRRRRHRHGRLQRPHRGRDGHDR